MIAQPEITNAFNDPRPGCEPTYRRWDIGARACNRLCAEGIQRCPRHAALDAVKTAKAADRRTRKGNKTA